MQAILTVNMGNTAVSFAVYRMNEDAATAVPLAFFRISAALQRTADEYAVLLSSLTERLEEDVQIVGAVVASVVPAGVGELCHALQMLFPETPLLTVGAGLRSGLTIRTDAPAELGADLVAMSVGAAALQKPPFLVLDCSAVTTLSAVDHGKDAPTYLGCAILAGPSLQAETMKCRTALLPDVLLQTPKKAIGTNTADSLRAGLLLGFSAAVSDLIRRFEAEIGKGELPVILTGEGANVIKPLLEHDLREDAQLVHRGLYKMALLNARKFEKAPKRG